MTTVSCPKCHDQVSVPASAPRGARVRCPLCQEEYDLADALAQLPPALIIVSSGALEEPVLAAVGSMDTATGSHIGSEMDHGFESHLEGGSGKRFSTGMLENEPSHVEMVTASAPSFRSAPRPKRKERSMVGELVKIVLGGVVGIGLAILILWWVAGVDLGLAPQVNSVSWLRWVLPPKFKKDADPENKEINPDDLQPVVPENGNGKTKPEKTAGGESKTSGTSGKKKTSSAASPPAELDASEFFAPTKSSGDDLKIENPLGIQPKMPAKAPEKTKPASGEPSIDETTEPKEEKPAEKAKDPAAEKPSAENPAEEPKEEKPAEKPAEPAEPAQETKIPGTLSEGIDAANSAAKTFDETSADDKEARKAAVTALYDAYAGLGRTVEQANLEDADNAEKLPALKQSLAHAASDPLKLNSIGFFAAKRLDATEGDAGILLAGKVTDLKAAGGHFETTLELVRDKRTVTVVSAKNPQDSYKVDDQVLILGSVVRDPKEKVPGYQGDAPVVVRSGHAMVVPGK